MPKAKSLQQKMVLFLLLPVAGLLITMGWLGFLYAKGTILKEWQEAAILRLQAAAHQVDMRLAEPKFWMQMFGKTGGQSNDAAIQKWIVQQLDHLQGVEKAAIIPVAGTTQHGSKASHDMLMVPNGGPPMKAAMGRMMAFERAEITQVKPPHYDANVGHKTVTLVSDLMNDKNQKVAELKVDVLFSYLLANTPAHGWKQEETAALIDDQGNELACSSHGRDGQACDAESAYRAVLKAMQHKKSGTLMGAASPPDEIIGYYRLKEAPWTLVLTARSSRVLAPINRFRDIFLIVATLFAVFILVLIRTVAGRMVASIRNVSQAAQRVAKGDYEVQLVNGSKDEVGQLIRSFNTMVSQLEDHMRLKAALELAMEVQQNLLPAAAPRFDGLDVAGASRYCDETGGDYYDFLECCDPCAGRLTLAIGDVVGHGISAALLMTTARAMLRTRILQPGNLDQVVADVNRLLCCDTDRTGNFMTLFLLSLDAGSNELRWVRAGHLPAIIYDRQTDRFEELRGEGMALGVFESHRFQEYRYRDWDESKLLFLGTDGIWEAENPQGERFGIERLRTVLRRHSSSSSQQIVDAVFTAVNDFRQDSPQEDDITMVVLKPAANGKSILAGSGLQTKE